MSSTRQTPTGQPHTGRAATRRERAAQARREQLARERRRRTVLVAAGVAVFLLVAVGLGAAYQSSRSTPSGQVAVPAGVTDGGIAFGQPTAPVTVTVYEDFQCPACRAFEQRAGDTLAQLRQVGTVRVVYKPIAFLDRAFTDRYSTRALNAAACLLDTHPQGFPTLHAALFAQQPREGGPGLSDRQLTDLTGQAGAPDAGTCIAERRFEPWTRQVTDQASQAGINQTPTVLVNGKPLADTTAAGLRAAVNAAA